MTEQFGGSSQHHVRVRVVSHSVASGLEQTINAVLEEEQASGAEVVDIQFTSTSPFETSTLTAARGEYVALILLRSGHARMASH
jgi:ACT domain-containing protein